MQIYILPNVLQGMTNNVGLTFSDGHTMLRFTINIKQDQHWGSRPTLVLLSLQLVLILPRLTLAS
jgi:hypothetical protein